MNVRASWLIYGPILLVRLCVRATFTDDVCSRLHLQNPERYTSCPFHAVNNEFACFMSDDKTSEILHNSPQSLIDARNEFAKPFLRNQTLLFVGDSLMRNQFVSLACLLWEADTTITKEEVDFAKPGAHLIYSKRFDTQLLFIFSTHLLDISAKRLPQLLNNAGSALLEERVQQAVLGRWRHMARKPNYTILTTAHHYARGKYNESCITMNGCAPNSPDLNIFLAAINRINALLHELSNDPGVITKILWRGVPPRHYSNGEWNTNGTCEEHSPCIEESALIQTIVDSNYWVALQTSRIIRDSAYSHGFQFIDIMDTSLTRCDGHVGNRPIGLHGKIADCSHYCVPGVPDTWHPELLTQLHRAHTRGR